MKTMKKLIFIFLVTATVFAYAHGGYAAQLLNVSKPSSVVAQPYMFRATLVPGSSEGVYTLGVEGYLNIFGLNFSVGTTFEYPNFELNQPVYVGLGISTGGLFVALSSNVPSFEQISDLSAYETPTVAFGVASYKKTSFLFASWSRFELSYENRGVFKKQDGQFVLNDSLDWLNATVNFKVESCDVGYFLFRFTVPSLKDVVEGSFTYTWELALPVSMIYVYVGQPDNNNWVLGLGIANSFFNAIGKYDIQTGQVAWMVSAQM